MSISGTPCTRDPPMDLWMNGWAVVVLVLVLVVDDDVVDKRLFGKHTERKEKREKREERREKREERRERKREAISLSLSLPFFFFFFACASPWRLRRHKSTFFS